MILRILIAQINLGERNNKWKQQIYNLVEEEDRNVVNCLKKTHCCSAFNYVEKVEEEDSNCKKEKAEKQMRENLQVGDEIVTIGGIYGRVISLKEDTIVIESKSDHSKMTIARWAMQQNLTVHDDQPSGK